jgi:hypothetical protein
MRKVVLGVGISLDGISHGRTARWISVYAKGLLDGSVLQAMMLR